MNDITSLPDDELMRLYQQSLQPQPTTVRPQGQPDLTEMSNDDLMAAYRKSQVEGWVDTGKGLYKALDAGVASGVAGMIGLPDTLLKYGTKGVNKLMETVYPRSASVGERIDAVKPQEESYPLKGILPTTETAKAAVQKDYFGGEAPYQPQNRAERYTHRVGEFATGAVGPGGPLRNLINFGIIPGLTTEGVSEATKGNKWAEGGAGVASSLLAAILNRGRAPAQTIGRATTEGLDPAIYDKAQKLVNSAEGMGPNGIRLTIPEAMEKIQPGSATGLLNLLRIAESHPESRATMAQVFADRPQQIEGAARESFETIAPRPTEPSMVGARAGETAERVGLDVEKARTRATDPYYRAAATDEISHPAMQNFISNLDAAIAQDKTGIVGNKLQEIRNLLVEAPAIPAVPGTPTQRIARELPKGHIYETIPGSPGTPAVPERFIRDIENVDRVRKYVREKMDMPQIGAEAITKEQGKGILHQLDALRAEMVAASPNFAAGKQLHADISERIKPVIGPTTPLGRLAGKDKTVTEAIEAVFGANSKASGSEQEISRAVSALAAKNPRVAQDLIRQHVEITFNKAAKNLIPGENQYGGAKFVSAIVGETQDALNLQAAIRASGPQGNQVWEGFRGLLDVLEATGKRQRPGSLTAFNAADLKSATQGGLVTETGKTVVAPGRLLTKLGDVWDNWQAGRNVNQMAKILTDPQASGYLRRIAAVPRGSNEAALVALRLLNNARIVGQ